MKILIYDDEEDVILNIAKQLINCCDNLIAYIGNQESRAIKVIEHINPDIVLLDLQRTDYGKCVGREIAKHFQYSKIRFIVHSSFSVLIQRLEMAKVANVRHFCLKNDFESIISCIRGECDCN